MEKQNKYLRKAKKHLRKSINIKCEKAKETYKTITAYKFRPINKNTISLLVQGKLYFSNIQSLNDPLECPLLHTSNERKKIFKDAYQPYILSLVVPSTIHTKNKQGIYTDLVNNTLLFSHYAEKHKGICIEYEIEKKALLEQAKMFYTRVQYSTDTHANSFENLFAIKDTKWKYENEGRFVAFSKQQDSNRTGNIYKGGRIKKIIFGLKTPKEDKELLYKLLHSNSKEHLQGIQFFNTKSNKESFFTLEFTPYDPTLHT